MKTYKDTDIEPSIGDETDMGIVTGFTESGRIVTDKHPKGSFRADVVSLKGIRCPCGGIVHVEHDVGSDVWAEGEEVQHIETCSVCGNWRFRTDTIIWDNEDCPEQPENEWFVTHGNWIKKQKYSMEDYY